MLDWTTKVGQGMHLVNETFLSTWTHSSLRLLLLGGLICGTMLEEERRDNISASKSNPFQRGHLVVEWSWDAAKNLARALASRSVLKKLSRPFVPRLR